MPSTAINQYLLAIKQGTCYFIKKRPEWIFSVLFFLLIVCIYVWGFKLTNHLTDKQYVKEYIAKAPPLQQFNLTGKIIRNEEFDIDRDLLTKSLHVKPHLRDDENFDIKPLELGEDYGFLQDDTVLYYFDNKWQKANLPFQQLLSQDPHYHFWENLRINKPDNLFMIYDEDRLAWWDPTQKTFLQYQFNTSALKSLAGDEGQKGVYLLDNVLGNFSSNLDTLFTISLARADSKQTTADSVQTRALPPGIVDIQSVGTTMAAHLYDTKKKKHSIRVWNGRFFEVNTIADSLLNIAVKESPSISWEISEEIYVVWLSNGATFLIDPHGKGILSTLKTEQDNHFTAMPDLYKVKNTVWLAGTMDNGYGFAKVNLSNKRDSGTFFRLPNFEQDYEGTPSLNISRDGLTIALVGSSGKIFRDLQFYRWNKNATRPDTVGLASYIDPSITENLLGYAINFPKRSQEFKFAATRAGGLGVSFEITPTKTPAEPDIAPIQDNNADNPQPIRWPGKNFMEVESSPDYFFMVILLIGVIIAYFFILIYIKDFKQRRKPLVEPELPILDELPTLKEKLHFTKDTMRSLKQRSEIMLWLGIVIGIAGMFAFVFSLKIFFADSTNLNWGPSFTVRMLRTFAIFSFMEVFSFYFLKQYRISFNEYKRFSSLYLRVMNYYQYVELMTKYPDDPTAKSNFKDLRDAMLKEGINLHEDGGLEKVNEFEKSVASDIVKTLADKIPTPKSGAG